MMDQGPHDKMHWGCCWAWLLGKVLWWAAFLALIGGLAALWSGGEFYGVTVMTWYWNALVGGVLALGAKASRHHYCMHQVMGK